MRKPRPNIVLLMVDQLAASALAAYGHPLVKSPHIDSIAKRGAVFENFYSNFPLCAPARHAEPKVQHSYDPDKVKFYLKAAGLQTLKVDLSTADAAFAGAVDTALLMKESAAKAGIDINVIREPNDGYWSNVWLKKPWCFCYWNGRTTQDAMLTTAYASGAAWNDTFWSNETFDKTLIAARSELNTANRAQMYADLQNLLAEDGGAMVLMFNNFVNAHSAKLGHAAIAPNYDVDGLKITQRWWFA